MFIVAYSRFAPIPCTLDPFGDAHLLGTHLVHVGVLFLQGNRPKKVRLIKVFFGVLYFKIFH